MGAQNIWGTSHSLGIYLHNNIPYYLGLSEKLTIGPRAQCCQMPKIKFKKKKRKDNAFW